MKQSEYHDNKWDVIVNKDNGTKVYCQCECGYKHDIYLSKNFDFIGRGTRLDLVEE